MAIQSMYNIFDVTRLYVGYCSLMNEIDSNTITQAYVTLENSDNVTKMTEMLNWRTG